MRENIVLNVGAIQHRKNIVRLVEAFERTPPGWKLVLAGIGGLRRRRNLRAHRAQPAARRYPGAGLRCRAKSWHAGTRRARVFAFPSLDEGFGMPVLEAMAAGVPGVGGEPCGVCRRFAEMPRCWSIRRDVEALAAALERLMSDDGLREQLIARGLERAAQFSWEKAAEQTWKVYQGFAELACCRSVGRSSYFASSSTAILSARKKRWSWLVNLILPVDSKVCFTSGRASGLRHRRCRHLRRAC